LNDPETVASHPEKKTLLALSPDVDAGVEKCSQKPSIAEKHPQKFVVIDVDVVKASCMKQVVTVNENCYSPPMTKLPRDIVRRIKIVHANKAPDSLINLSKNALKAGVGSSQ
jgi:hypothetical protein